MQKKYNSFTYAIKPLGSGVFDVGVQVPSAAPDDANLNSTKVFFLSGLLVAVTNWQNKKA